MFHSDFQKDQIETRVLYYYMCVIKIKVENLDNNLLSDAKLFSIFLFYTIKKKSNKVPTTELKIKKGLLYFKTINIP